jgi:hypothetical protein
VWNVPKTFEDSSTMGSGKKYGLKIVDDLTGKFEYSPPFDMTVPSSTFGGAASASKPTATSISEQRDISDSEDSEAETLESPAKGAPSIIGSTGSLSQIPDLGLIFGAAGAGVGGLIVIIVIVAVYLRIRSDRKKAEYHNPRSFRDRRSVLEAETPIVRGHHRRISSSSSFGDGARPSQVFSFSPRAIARSPSPPPPLPTQRAIAIASDLPQLRNPPPRLGPPLVPPGCSPPPPMSPPAAVIANRPSVTPLSFAIPAELYAGAPYAPRVYTPMQDQFENHPL